MSLTMAYVGNKGHTRSSTTAARRIIRTRQRSFCRHRTASRGSNSTMTRQSNLVSPRMAVLPIRLFCGATMGVSFGLCRFGVSKCGRDSQTQSFGRFACGVVWLDQRYPIYASDADTHYNSLQVTLAKTFTHGYSVTANYAWQRGTAWSSGFYTWVSAGSEGPDTNIRQQQVIIYGLAELPFGRNKLLLSHANAVVNQIVGGWQISPVLNYSSGLPFTLSYSSCNASIPGSAPCRVNGQPDLNRI